MAETFDRQEWDALVERAVADDPILAALDMGVLEGMSPGQVDLFFETVLHATPTDEELYEQSRLETAARMQQYSMTGDDLRSIILETNPRLRAQGSAISAHPWSDPWEDLPSLVDHHASAVRVLAVVLTLLAITILACGILVGLAA